MTLMDFWVEDFLKLNNAKSLDELDPAIIKQEIEEMKGAISNNKVFKSSGYYYGPSYVEDMMNYIKVLKGALK
jgi:hypothetical protein